MKALLIQKQNDVYDRTGIFSVATQWGHIGNDAWLWEGRVVCRDDIDGRYDNTNVVTEAELTVVTEP